LGDHVFIRLYILREKKDIAVRKLNVDKNFLKGLDIFYLKGSTVESHFTNFTGSLEVLELIPNKDLGIGALAFF